MYSLDLNGAEFDLAVEDFGLDLGYRLNDLVLVLGLSLVFHSWYQGRREFPFGNSRESATSKIPGGNFRELLSSRREFLGFYKISNSICFLL